MATFGISRAIFRAMVPQLYGMGMSFNRMIREARAWGRSYRRQTMLADIREITGMYAKQYFITSMKRDIMPRPGVMVETVLRRASKYMIRATNTYQNRVTGETSVRDIAFYADNRQTLDAYEAGYKAAIRDMKEYQDEDLLNMEFKAIFHNEGMPY